MSANDDINNDDKDIFFIDKNRKLTLDVTSIFLSNLKLQPHFIRTNTILPLKVSLTFCVFTYLLFKERPEKQYKHITQYS